MNHFIQFQIHVIVFRIDPFFLGTIFQPSGHTVEIEYRGHTIHVLDLKMIVELKRTSKDPIDKQRLPVFEETLRQMEMCEEERC